MAPVLLALHDVGKRFGDVAALSGVTAEFRQGELTAIMGGRGSGKSVLAALIAGQRMADQGTIWRAGAVAPPAGAAWGFGVAGTVERDLSLRAAAYGLDTDRYVGAIAALLPRPDVLHQPFERLAGNTRTLVLYAACYLIPAPIYVIDGTPLPNTHGAWGALEALFQAIRPRAAVVWLASGVTFLRRFEPHCYGTLARGRLTMHPGLDGALATFSRDDSRVAGV